MLSKKTFENYRKDIDGLRAIAVLAVIAFHFGFLPNGYLGVDVFFVISGFLITKIIYKETVQDRFSIAQFYLRRTRRIIPLLLVVCLVTLITGIIVMLPDDLENLSQSVIATNLFSNNILQYITTKNYWEVVNEFKPLMHTWSLGIEEQFYLFYPLVFLFLAKKRVKWILPALILLSVISLLMYLNSSYEPAKFYLLPYRFFEMSIGGISAVYLKDKLIESKFSILFIPLLLIILLVDIGIPDYLKLCLTVLLSVGFLSSDNNNKITSLLLENKAMLWTGKISFSLYMWHQFALAFIRYFAIQQFSVVSIILTFVLIFIISTLSYLYIEQPFRDKKRVSTPLLLWTVSVLFVITTAVSAYLYIHAGVIRDVPELGISKAKAERNMHSKYNDLIYNLDKEFVTSDKIKVLIVGNSFARDWANILLESKYRDSIEISYIFDYTVNEHFAERFRKADYVFFSVLGKKALGEIGQKYKVDTAKIAVTGTKNFGLNNGVFYNRKRDENYYAQRTMMEKGYLHINDSLKEELGTKYIDLIGKVIGKDSTMPVFTPDHMFISQDCRHLTRSGAQYFARLLNNDNSFHLTRK